MAKLYFYYASMNAGKSMNLLQADFNYRERGMVSMLWTAAIDNRFKAGTISSRIGLLMPANLFHAETDLGEEIRARHALRPLDCVLVDEAQFLTRAQVLQLAAICDETGIPVLTYGLRTDFRAELFEGSKWLLALADSLHEIKAVCGCGRKSTMNLRLDADGRVAQEGAQTEIGGNDIYVAVCRRHFMAAIRSGSLPDAIINV